MAALERPWAAYLRLQEELSSHKRISDRTWGIEDVLDQIVTTGHPSTQIEIERAIASGARRARHRAQLRTIYQSEEEEAKDQFGMLAARQSLRFLLERAKSQDIDLLVAVAEGHDYSALAAEFQSPTGTLRTRVSRLRSEYGDLTMT